MTLKAMTKRGLLIPVGLLVAAVGLSMLVSDATPLSGEDSMLEAVRNTEIPLLHQMSESLDWLGNRWVIVASVLALSGALWALRLRREALACLLIIPMELMTLGIREIIDRQRPILLPQEWTTMAPTPGFPSGTTLHAVLLFGFVAYLVHVYVRPGKARLALQGLMVLAIAVVSYSRVYVGVHWPADILGAWLYGGFFLWVIVAVCLPVLSRLGRDGFPPSRE